MFGATIAGENVLADQSQVSYRGSDPYIFMCYARRDADTVSPELRWLHKQGFNVWYDDGIGAGSDWREEIAQAIKHANLLLYFVTPQSVESEHCRKEAHFAIDNHIPVVAVHMKATHLPDGLSMALSDRQAINKHELTEQDYRQKLMRRMFAYMDNSPGGIAENIDSIRPEERRNDSGTEARQNNTVAVLAFENLSDEASQEFFSDGLSEDILNGLARTPGFTVRARASSFSFKGDSGNIRNIGHLLNVAHLVTGSVRKAGNRIRVSVQLIDVRDDTHLWAEKYDRDLVDVFAVQDEITTAILKALDVYLPSANSKKIFTTSREAHNEFLVGRQQLNLMQFDAAIEAFEKAVALDPDYAEAYGQLALVHSLYIWWVLVPAKEKMADVISAADRAIAIDPEQQTALMVRATNLFFVDKDCQTALNELHRLLLKNPNDTWLMAAYSSILHAAGRSDLGIRLQRQAVALNPLSPHAHHFLSEGLAYAKRWQEAESAQNQTERMGFDDPVLSIAIAMGQRDLGRALEIMHRWKSETYFLGLRSVFRALFALLAGDVAESQEILRAEKETSNHGRMWELHFQLLCNNVEEAYRLFAELIDEGEYLLIRDACGKAITLRSYKDFTNDPRYAEIMSKAGLKENFYVSDLPF